MPRSKNGRNTAKTRPGETPAETGSSTGAPELRDLLNSCLFDLFDRVPSCQPIAAGPQATIRTKADKGGKTQKDANGSHRTTDDLDAPREPAWTRGVAIVSSPAS